MQRRKRKQTITVKEVAGKYPTRKALTTTDVELQHKNN